MKLCVKALGVPTIAYEVAVQTRLLRKLGEPITLFGERDGKTWDAADEYGKLGAEGQNLLMRRRRRKRLWLLLQKQMLTKKLFCEFVILTAGVVRWSFRDGTNLLCSWLQYQKIFNSFITLCHVWSHQLL